MTRSVPVLVLALARRQHTRVLTIVAVLTVTTTSVLAAPGPPTGLRAIVYGSTVSLDWTAPPGVAVLGYRLEAGSFFGSANIATFPLGSTPAFLAVNVPAGIYYVRVRAIASDGVSTASNEAIVVVGGGGCTAPPGAPLLGNPSVTGTAVVLNWATAAAGCEATHFSVHAGSASGLSNLAIINLGNTLGLAANAPVGTYYVRVVARNASGFSAPSNEIIVIIGGAPPIPGGGSFGPGQYRVNVQIAAGRYYSDPSDGCYWERQRGFSGSSADIIANEFIGFDARQTIVDILPSDVGFETTAACGTWFTTPRQGPLASIQPGTWLVGTQLTPGLYYASTAPGCYWARLSNFTGNSNIIDNDFVSDGGGQFVAIIASDTGFETTAACGVWSRQ